MVADELDLHQLPKVGSAGMPTGSQVEVMTPGQNAKHDLAGALELAAGTLHYALEPRTTNAWFRDLRSLLADRYPCDRWADLGGPQN